MTFKFAERFKQGVHLWRSDQATEKCAETVETLQTIPPKIEFICFRGTQTRLYTRMPKLKLEFLVNK